MTMDLEVAIIQLHETLRNRNWDHYKTMFTINHIEITNKMRPCSKIYYANVS